MIPWIDHSYGREVFLVDSGFPGSLLPTALKIVSYFTIIIPLIALAANAVLRFNHSFFLHREPEASLYKFYFERGIFENPTKPVEIDPDTQQLLQDRYGRGTFQVGKQIVDQLNRSIQDGVGPFIEYDRSLKVSYDEVLSNIIDTPENARRAAERSLRALVERGQIFSFKRVEGTNSYDI